MKFSTTLLTVLAASSSLALTIPDRMLKREDTSIKASGDDYDYSYLGVNPIFPIKKECDDYMKNWKEFEQCYQTTDAFETGNLDDICKTFNSDTCQKVFNTKLSDIPACKDSEPISLMGMEYLLNNEYTLLKMMCATDENGKYCPLNPNEMEKRVNETMSEEQQSKVLDEVLNETCKSKKCTEASTKYFDELTTGMKKYTDEMKKITGDNDSNLMDDVETDLMKDPTTNKTIAYLKSDQCKAQVQTSDAAHVTYAGAIMVTLALVLSSLL